MPGSSEAVGPEPLVQKRRWDCLWIVFVVVFLFLFPNEPRATLAGTVEDVMGPFK